MTQSLWQKYILGSERHSMATSLARHRWGQFCPVMQGAASEEPLPQGSPLLAAESAGAATGSPIAGLNVLLSFALITFKQVSHLPVRHPQCSWQVHHAMSHSQVCESQSSPAGQRARPTQTAASSVAAHGHRKCTKVSESLVLKGVQTLNDPVKVLSFLHRCQSSPCQCLVVPK